MAREGGFAPEEDFADGGSDRLLDATFALGGVDAAVRRVDEHFAAGADHVAVQVITARQGLPTREWRELAVLNEIS